MALLVKGVNDFESAYPSIANEWHPTKNGELTPANVSSGSNRRVWWLCSLCGNEWEATIWNRGKGHTGCPKCKRELHTSFPEQAILFYLSKKIEVKSRYIVHGKEADIFIPSLGVAIEYDGYFFHGKSKKKNYDGKKNKVFSDNGIRLIRIIDHRENMITKVENDIIHCHSDQKYHFLKKVIEIIFNLIMIKHEDIEIDIDNDYQLIMSQYITFAKTNSLAVKNPNLASEWHPTKNGDLKPIHFQVSSSKYVWWLGKCGHEWQSKISNRNRGKGCPYCNQYSVNEHNNLLALYPEIASEWHPTKNNGLLPQDFLPGSNKKVWWLDSDGNEWETQINIRVNYNTDAPQKRGKKSGQNRILSKIAVRGSLGSNYPLLLKKWDFEKNKEVDPYFLLDTSHLKVWWKCDKCGYEYLNEVRGEVAKYNNNSPCKKCKK